MNEITLLNNYMENRVSSLRAKLEKKNGLRIMEKHSPLSAMLVENIQFNNSNELIEYDGFWSSSLTDSTISGIVGTGSSIILLPVLSFAFGPKAAIPIMAIASVMGNISRVIMWRKDVQIKAFLLYSIPAIPFAVLGANTLWVIPANLSNICIGLFFCF